MMLIEGRTLFIQLGCFCVCIKHTHTYSLLKLYSDFIFQAHLWKSLVMMGNLLVCIFKILE